MTFIVNYQNTGDAIATYGSHGIRLTYYADHHFAPDNILAGVKMIFHFVDEVFEDTVFFKYDDILVTSNSFAVFCGADEIHGGSAVQLCNRLIGYINLAIEEGVE